MQNRAELIKKLLEHRYRVFNIGQFTEIAGEMGYSHKSINQLVFNMKKSGIIEAIKPGIFQLNDSYLSSPVSVYEVGLTIVPECYLSYLTAITIHGLTDQLADIIYLSVGLSNNSYSNKKGKYNFEAKGSKYKIVKVSKSHIFGIEKKWYGDYRISISDLERTLVDCINHPQYAAGFYEVISYFDQARTILQLDKIISYATRISQSCLQRVGWVFEKIGFEEGVLEVMKEIEANTWVKLDSSRDRRGTYNKKWKVIENI